MAIPILVVILVAVNAVVLTVHADTSKKLEEQRSMAVKTKTELTGASKRLQELETEKSSVASSLRKEELKSKKLARENEALKAKREAIRKKAQEEAAKPAPQVAQAAQPKVRTVSVSGSCDSWIASAGISDVANAKDLISRESGCNPNAVNPSSGACGVAQELPCGKSGCSLGDGACQVAWMRSYVLNRYGSFANAIAHHNANNWY